MLEVEYNVDVVTKRLMNVANQYINPADIVWAVGDTFLVRLNLKIFNGSAWEAFPVTAGTTFDFIIKDPDTLDDTTPEAFTEDFTIESAAGGIISFELSLVRGDFTAFLATDEAEQEFTAQLRMYDTDLNPGTLVGQDLTIWHAPRRGDESLSGATILQYSTTAQMTAYVLAQIGALIQRAPSGDVFVMSAAGEPVVNLTNPGVPWS